MALGRGGSRARLGREYADRFGPFGGGCLEPEERRFLRTASAALFWQELEQGFEIGLQMPVNPC